MLVFGPCRTSYVLTELKCIFNLFLKGITTQLQGSFFASPIRVTRRSTEPHSKPNEATYAYALNEFEGFGVAASGCCPKDLMVPGLLRLWASIALHSSYISAIDQLFAPLHDIEIKPWKLYNISMLLLAER